MLKNGGGEGEGEGVHLGSGIQKDREKNWRKEKISKTKCPNIKMKLGLLE